MPKLIKSTVEIEGRIAERYALVEGDELPAWGADAELGIVGYPAARVDGAARAGGMARYTADVQLPGMAYTAFVPCPHPHARLLSIDVAAARKLPGVLGVLTRREVAAQLRPGSTSGLGGALALRYGDELCYAGEIVAAVAASDPDIAADAVALIAAEYATLPHVVDLEAAARPDAPSARPGGNLFGSQPHVVERGDVAAGLASAEVVVEQTYRTAGQVHSCLEPHGTVAHWEGDMLTIYETTQHVFGSRNLLADWLGLPRSQVRVICQYLGGGFGSKAEPGPTTVYAALLARQIRRPVRAVYPRAIEQIAGGHRSATITHVKLGARRDGSLTAIELRCLTDLGAYGAWLPDVPAPALLMYRCANARAENLGVFTNTGTFEAFRAPGFVEGTFAIESAIDNARLQLIDIAAQLFEVAPDALEVRGGAIYSGEARLSSVRELAQKLGDAMISGSGSRGPNPEGVRIVTSGAQFVEVEVDTFTGRVRVVRVVAAHDCGRIVNPLTFRSQIECGIIQGLGYALTERRMIDSTAGLALNANLADYKLPTSADVPPIEVLRIDIPDLAANPTGAKGAGEPPIIPTAAAIANAVADAIGVRIRELPITPEKVLDALRGASSAQ